MLFLRKNSIVLSFILIYLFAARETATSPQNVYPYGGVAPPIAPPIGSYGDNFNIGTDALEIQRALKDYQRPNIKLVIDILTHRSSQHRMELVKFLNSAYNINMLAELKKFPSGVRDFLKFLVRQWSEFNSINFVKTWAPHLANKSNKLFQILNAITEPEIGHIREAYRHVQLKVENEISHRLQNDFQLNHNDEDDDDNDEMQPYQQFSDVDHNGSGDFYKVVQILHNALQSSTPSLHILSDILSQHNRAQLIQIAKIYRIQYKMDLTDAIDDNLDGVAHDVLMALLAPQPDFDDIWLTFKDTPSIIEDIIHNACSFELGIINSEYNKLFAKIEFTFKKLAEFGMLDENYVGAVNAFLMRGSKENDQIQNCNYAPDLLAQRIHQDSIDTRTLEQTVATIFTTCNREHRLAVAAAYPAMFNIDLSQHLSSIFWEPELRNLIRALLIPYPQFTSNYFYNYLVPHLANPQIMLDSLNHIPHHLHVEILDTYNKLLIEIEQPLLIILQYRLWRNNRYENVRNFLESLQGATATNPQAIADPYPNFSEEANILYNAVSFKDIINLLASRPIDQRCDIVKTFHALYNQDLLSILISKLPNPAMQDALIVWLTPFPTITVRELYDLWLPSDISYSNDMHYIASSFTTENLEHLNTELKLNIDIHVMHILDLDKFVDYVDYSDYTDGMHHMDGMHYDYYGDYADPYSNYYVETFETLTKNTTNSDKGKNTTKEEDKKDTEEKDETEPKTLVHNLHDAIEAANKTILDGILTNLNTRQRLDFLREYHSLYKIDFISDLKNHFPNETDQLYIDITHAYMTPWPPLRGLKYYRDTLPIIKQSYVLRDMFTFCHFNTEAMNRTYAELGPYIDNKLTNILKDHLYEEDDKKENSTEVASLPTVIKESEVSKDVQYLYNALHSTPPDFDIIDKILTHYHRNQLYEIAKAYEKKYNKILLLEVYSKLQGPIRDLSVVALMHIPFENVETVLNYWLPVANRSTDILDHLILTTDAPQVKNFNDEANIFTSVLDEKLNATLVKYGQFEKETKRVQHLLPKTHFNPYELGNKLHILLRNIAHKEDVIQFLTRYSNDERLDIINSMIERYGKNTFMNFLDALKNEENPEKIIASLSPLPKFNENELFKQRFGQQWLQESKSIVRIIQNYATIEMTRYSDLYQHIKTKIENELASVIEWIVNKMPYAELERPQPLSSSIDHLNYAKTLNRNLNETSINIDNIIEIFTTHNTQQLALIAKIYREEFNEDLKDLFNKHLDKHFANLLFALMTPAPEFIKTWLSLSNEPDVVNEILPFWYTKHVKAANAAYKQLSNAIDEQLRLMLKSRIWEEPTWQGLNAVFHKSDEVKKELCDTNPYALHRLLENSENEEEIITNAFKNCNMAGRMEIVKNYKETYDNDFISIRVTSEYNPKFYDIIEALITPFPEINEDDLLHMLLGRKEIFRNQLEILKGFSYEQIENVKNAYKELHDSIDINLSAVLQNDLWEGEKLKEVFEFLHKVQNLTQAYPLKYAEELYNKWRPTSLTHSIWGTLSSKAMRNLEDSCDNLRLYLQQRFKLFFHEKFTTLDAKERYDLVQLLHNSHTGQKKCATHHDTYVVRLHKNMDHSTLKRTVEDIVTNCDLEDIETITKSLEGEYDTNLIDHVNNHITKGYFHDLVMTLLEPFPSEFNHDIVYNHWLEFWQNTAALKDSTNEFKSIADNTINAYKEMKRNVQNKILFILRNNLHKNDKFTDMIEFIELMSSGSKVYGQQDVGSTTVENYKSFYPENDACILNVAARGTHVDARQIANLLNNRSHNQRIEMTKSLKGSFVDYIKNMHGGLRNITFALMTPYPGFHIHYLFNEWPLKKLKSSKIVRALPALAYKDMEEFAKVCLQTKLYMEEKLRSVLNQWSQPKCLKIKTTPPVPSIKPASKFDALEDAQILKTAIADNKKPTIIDIFIHRNSTQRMEINEAINGTTIYTLIKNRFWHQFKELAMALVTSVPELISNSLHDYTLKHLDYAYGIIDFLATSTNNDFTNVKQKYKQRFPDSDMANLVKQRLIGVATDMSKTLIDLKRNEEEEITDDQVQAEAEFLFELGYNKYFRSLEEEQRVANIFATHSRDFLHKLFEYYETHYDECIETAMAERGLHRDLELLVLAIIQAAKSTPDYYADRLYDILSGSHVIHHNDLIRIAVGRSEIDLHDIWQAFDEKHSHEGLNLLKFIKKQNGDHGFLDTIKAIIEPDGSWNATMPLT